MSSSSSRKAFTLLEVIITVVIIAALGTAAFFLTRKDDTQTASGDNSQNTEQQKKTVDTSEAAPALQNLGLKSISENTVSTQATREYTQNGHKGMYIFGDSLGKGDPRKNPNFEFASIKPGTQIIAAIDGIVGFIKEQSESNDYEVFLQPKDGSIWVLGYDHLVNLKVTKGQKVTAGMVLGEAAIQNNGLYRFEFQVNKEDPAGTLHICPTTLLAADKKEAVLAEITEAQNSWESVSKLDLYDLAKQNPVGCMGTELTPAVAEGRSS